MMKFKFELLEQSTEHDEITYKIRITHMEEDYEEIHTITESYVLEDFMIKDTSYSSAKKELLRNGVPEDRKEEFEEELEEATENYLYYVRENISFKICIDFASWLAPIPPKTIKKVTNKEITLHTEAFGNPELPCLLMISSTNAPSSFWNDELCKTIVSKGYYVIKFDNRDIGLSSTVADDKKYTIKDLASDAMAVLRAYDIEKFSVVGHSIGAFVALRLAVDNPDMINTCITVGAGLSEKSEFTELKQEVINELMKNNPTGDFENDLPGWIELFKFLNGEAELNEHIATEYVKSLYTTESSYKVFANHMKFDRDLGDLISKIPSIKAKTYAIIAECDPFVDHKEAHNLNKLFKKYDREKVDEAGHLFFNFESQMRLGSHIVDFLNKIN
jgi:pimeloyl-ACP methyl ester carboxylesterase